jgi:N-acetylmuramoyl-L-alanine amidase
MKPKIALCVGHSRTIGNHRDGGAESWDGKTNEWEFNVALAGRIKLSLASLGIESVVIDNYNGDGYGVAQRWLASQIKALGCNTAIELHFNSAGPLAQGHEVLFWRGSKKSQALASFIEKEMSAHFKTPARGVKACTNADRGAEFLKLTHCPAVILEPFFGSSKQDWEAMASTPGLLAMTIADAISYYVSTTY